MEKLLTPQEMADILSVQLSTIYQWTHQEYIPHIKIGGLLRFRMTDIANWLDKRAVRGRPTRLKQAI